MSLIERLAGRLLGERVSPPASLPDDLVPPDVVLRRGRAVPWIGGLLARMGAPAAAVTLRRTIIFDPGVPITPTLLAHELAHVRQWREDRLFPLRYTVATLRHGYRDNPYEVEARAIAASHSGPSSAEGLT